MDDEDPILFDDVTYGKSGAFAINIWAKKNIFSSSRDDRDHYLFSHSSIAGALATDLDPEKSNQVRIVLLIAFSTPMLHDSREIGFSLVLPSGIHLSSKGATSGPRIYSHVREGTTLHELTSLQQ